MLLRLVLLFALFLTLLGRSRRRLACWRLRVLLWLMLDRRRTRRIGGDLSRAPLQLPSAAVARAALQAAGPVLLKAGC